MKNTLIVLSLAATCACVTASSQEPMKPSAAIEAIQFNDDKDFFETAASAGMLEVEAGKLAEQKSTNEQVKKFAATMIKDHEKAADELEALAKKKNITLPTTMLKRHQMMYDGLADEKRGKEFDEEYRTKMIASHKEAVSLFDQAAKKSKDPDVKAFAAKLLPTLQHHGGMAEQLPKA